MNRKRHEIQWEIDAVNREMARLVISQSDMDDQLNIYDRRIKFLQTELEAANLRESQG